ncbi:MAG: hypothetical protein Q9226_001358 [Calogaya cf. arnoldii]
MTGPHQFTAQRRELTARPVPPPTPKESLLRSSPKHLVVLSLPLVTTIRSRSQTIPTSLKAAPRFREGEGKPLGTIGSWLDSIAAQVIALRALDLHRDDSFASLSPFNTEVWRRLWWQIIILDGRAAEDRGIASILDEHQAGGEEL